MLRGTTQTLTFTLPEKIDMETLYISFAQNDDIVLEKELGDVLLDGTNIILPLSQEDTLKFIVGTATIQIRLRDTNGNALASNPMYIQVEKIYKDGVI